MGRQFATWSEEFEYIGFQKGNEKGRAEGEAKGREEGQISAMRGVLTHLLCKRFGDLPQAATQRIGAATLAQLELWCERSIDAPSLAAVFGDDAASA